MKVSNKIYNDINFTALCYNGSSKMLIVGDFGGYLMTMQFNKIYGDIEEEGISFKKKVEPISLKSKTTLVETYYLEQTHKPPNKKAIGDPPLSK